MNEHLLLNKIIKAAEKLSAPELQMLEDIARRKKETAPELRIIDTDDEQIGENLE